MQRSMLMRGMLAVFVLSVTAPITAGQVAGGTNGTKPTGTVPDVVVGQLVDSECNMVMATTAMVLAPEHLKCAIACAQKGGRLAVVTAKGEVYRVIGTLTQDNNAKLIQFVNQNVTVTGTIGTITAALQPATGVVDPVIQPPPPGPVKPDTRRPTGSEGGVVTKSTYRKGDFREGDVRASTELSRVRSEA